MRVSPGTLERNVQSIVSLLLEKQGQGARTLEVREDLHRRYNDWMEERFALYSWGSSSCDSYYRNAAGRAPQMGYHPSRINAMNYSVYGNKVSVQEYCKRD